MSRDPTFDSNLSSEDTYDHILLSFEKSKGILCEMLTAHEMDTQFRKTYVLLSLVDDILEDTEKLFHDFVSKWKGTTKH